MMLGSQTTGDNHFIILLQRFADGIQRFFNGGINKAASVDNQQLTPLNNLQKQGVYCAITLDYRRDDANVTSVVHIEQCAFVHGVLGALDGVGLDYGPELVELEIH